MSKYLLHNSLTAVSGKRIELADILREASALVSSLPGNLLYAVSINPADENRVWVTEIWQNKDAHTSSLTDPRVRMLIMRGVPLLAEMPQKGEELQVLVTGLRQV